MLQSAIANSSSQIPRQVPNAVDTLAHNLNFTCSFQMDATSGQSYIDRFKKRTCPGLQPGGGAGRHSAER